MASLLCGDFYTWIRSETSWEPAGTRLINELTTEYIGVGSISEWVLWLEHQASWRKWICQFAQIHPIK